MNDLSAAIFILLQLVLWAVIWTLAVTWLAHRLLPGNKWLKRSLKKTARLIMVEPFQMSFRAFRWLTVKLLTTRTDYRLHQILLENYPLTPLAFYDATETVIAQRRIIGVESSRVTRREWHLFSTRRIYLLIRFRDAVCFVGALPLGTSFLVSWRYAAAPNKIFLILFQVPYIGAAAEKLLSPPTFYRTDVYYAFEQIVRSAILETTALLNAQGVRPLTENEQRPLLREFYE